MDIYDPFVNLIASYFGDEGDESALTQIQRDLPNFPYMREVLRDGFAHALTDPNFDRKKLVKYYANRNGETDEKARAWLTKIRDELFSA
jgi:hypothetical protein